MNNSDLIKSAKEAVRNGTVLTQGVVDLLCDALAKSDKQLHAVVADNAALKAGLQNAFDEMESHHDDEGLYSYDADGEKMDALLRVCDAQGTISNLAEIKTPATDDVIADLRAEGVDMLAESYEAAAKDSDDFKFINHCNIKADQAREFAAQLRSQSEQVKGVQGE